MSRLFEALQRSEPEGSGSTSSRQNRVANRAAEDTRETLNHAQNVGTRLPTSSGRFPSVPVSLSPGQPAGISVGEGEPGGGKIPISRGPVEADPASASAQEVIDHQHNS